MRFFVLFALGLLTGPLLLAAPAEASPLAPVTAKAPLADRVVSFGYGGCGCRCYVERTRPEPAPARAAPRCCAPRCCAPRCVRPRVTCCAPRVRYVYPRYRCCGGPYWGRWGWGGWGGWYGYPRAAYPGWRGGFGVGYGW